MSTNTISTIDNCDLWFIPYGFHGIRVCCMTNANEVKKTLVFSS